MDRYEKLCSTAIEAMEQATRDAESFVDEFGCALDPERTDWDGTAWIEFVKSRRLDPEATERIWPLYQATLVTATRGQVRALTVERIN